MIKVRTKPPTKTLGDNLRDLRLSRRMTQKQIASLLFCSERIVQDWEQNRRNMPKAKWELLVIKLAPGV
jgi:transcriptional regulator with XRE-family HTH domain